MRLLNVPRYEQPDASSCLAACALMVVDYWARRFDPDPARRIRRLQESFAFGFRPAGGRPPPALTGLAARALAERGFEATLFTRNPDLEGTGGLAWLTQPPWSFTEQDFRRYTAHAADLIRGFKELPQARLVPRGIAEHELEEALDAGRPAILLFDDGFLSGAPEPVVHAAVACGLGPNGIVLQDPFPGRPAFRSLDRCRFLAAHRRPETDQDCLVIGPQEKTGA